MQLHGLAAFVDRFGRARRATSGRSTVVAGSVGSSGSTCDAAVEHVERLVETPERGVHQRAAHVAPCRRSAAPASRLRELRLGFREPVLEHVQAVRAIAAQLGSQAAGVHRALVRLEELGVDVARRAHAERREHQVARGQALPGAEVGGALARRALEAVDGAIGALARAPVPEVPARANQLLGRGNLEAVADLRPMRDPAAVFAEALPAPRRW